MEIEDGRVQWDLATKHELWRISLSVMYDCIANKKLIYPALSCRWGPRGMGAIYSNDQKLYFTQRSCGSAPDALVIADVEVVKPSVTLIGDIPQFDTEKGSLFVKHSYKITHPGEVNKIREFPIDKNIVATHTDSPDVLIWNVRECSRADARPDLVLKGHQDNAEFALAWFHSSPFVLSGGADKAVVLWNIEDHSHALSSKSLGSSNLSSKQSVKLGEDKNKYSPSLGSRDMYQGHDAIVEDVQLSPFSVNEFCSVGDDGCLILWDARVGITPAIKVEKAHETYIFCVDWNRNDDHFILTGSADKSVRLFDRRKLTSDSVGLPVHTFGYHDSPVLCVQWCPDSASMFGSAAFNGLLNVWDHAKVGKNMDRIPWPAPPPELLLHHVGHRDRVVDFQWNPDDPWTIVSLSDDGESAGKSDGNGSTLQVWRFRNYSSGDELIRYRTTPKSRRICDPFVLRSKYF